jgi:hypothetical protein
MEGEPAYPGPRRTSLEGTAVDGSRCAIGLLALAAFIEGGSATAQTVRGTILDSGSGEPVSLAYVGLLAEGREMVVAALVGGGGDFELEAPTPGPYYLYVARTGYETLMDGVFELGSDGVFDLRIGLKPSPVPLEPLTVEATRDVSPLEAVGFYERAMIGNGDFITREQIERRVVERVTDAFRDIPNLGVDASRPVIGSPDVMRNPALVITRGARRCNPSLYVDGEMVATGVMGPVRPDDFVGPRDVEAAEVYVRSSEVPVRFAAVGDCGVVLLWTKVR